MLRFEFFLKNSIEPFLRYMKKRQNQDFAQSCIWNGVRKKLTFPDRKKGNTPKFPSIET